LHIVTIFCQEYSSVSTIAGLHYIFEAKNNKIQTCFWMSILALNVVLSLYWSAAMYIDWKKNAVVTTIATSALDIKNIDFPSVTFCSTGFYAYGIDVACYKPL